MARNVEHATVCVGLKERRIGGYTLRPLISSDFTELHSILSSREDMTWERVPATLEYSKRLLTLRLEHYSKFRFGIMAVIDAREALVGQAGLQVINDPALDRVEVVVFLRADVIGSGLGTLLCEYYITESRICGLDEIYATVRPQNLAALKLVTKLGFVFVEDMIYYGKTCGLWRLKLQIPR